MLAARFFVRIVEPFAVGGSITGLARGTRDVARGVSEAQTGLLRTYALAIAGGGESIIRQVYEASEYSPDAFPPEEAARDQARRDELWRKAARP